MCNATTVSEHSNLEIGLRLEQKIDLSVSLDGLHIQADDNDGVCSIFRDPANIHIYSTRSPSLIRRSSIRKRRNHREDARLSLREAQNSTATQPTQRLLPPIPPTRKDLPAKEKLLELTKERYEPDPPQTKRNQHVLGLRYIHEKFGRTQRPSPHQSSPPDHVDAVFKNRRWDADRIFQRSPPGLGVQPGQSLPYGHPRWGKSVIAERSTETSLGKYWHYRARRARQEHVRQDDHGNKHNEK